MAYRSIFLDIEWSYTQYYGWKCVFQGTDVRVIRKRRGIFTRYLALIEDGGCDEFRDWIETHYDGGRFSEIIVHAFGEFEGRDFRLGSKIFKMIEGTSRLLNTATFVINLNDNYEDLQKKMGAKSRNSIRKADSLGVTVVPSENYEHAISVFLRQSAALVKRYGLVYPSRRRLISMVYGGHLQPFIARSSDGMILGTAFIYRTKNSAFYMYGSSSDCMPSGTGQLIQWKIILHYKDLGFAWYDLGGVADRETSIYRFKQSLGGDFVNLGTEWKCAGALYDLAMKAFLVARGISSAKFLR